MVRIPCGVVETGNSFLNSCASRHRPVGTVIIFSLLRRLDLSLAKDFQSAGLNQS